MNIIQMINVSPLVTISIIALTIDLTIFGYYYIKAKALKKLLRLFVAVLFYFSKCLQL